MKAHIEKQIERLQEKIKETNSENFKNYLYGKLDVYTDILHMIKEGEKKND